MIRSILIFILLFVAVRTAHADGTPVVTLEPGYGTTDDSFELQVTVSGKSSGRLAPPQFEESEDFEIVSLGTSTRRHIINGAQGFQISFNFQVTAKRELKPGDYSLPNGSISIDGESVRLTPGKLTILSSAAVKTKTTQPAGVDFTQVVDNEEPYVNEQIIYRAEIASSLGIAGAKLGDVAFNGFWHESFGKDQEQRRAVGDTVVYSIREALFPTRAAELDIPPRPLSVNVRIPRPRARRSWDVFDDFWADLDVYGNFQDVTRHLTAPAVKLRVKELPPPPKPDLDYVPVGDVRVSEKSEPRQLKQGESVTLTIELFGDANLKPYELPKPSGGNIGDFTVYPDQPQVTVSAVRERIFFKKIFHIALIPKRAGRLALPSYEIVTFDPNEKQYKIQHTAGGIVDVLPGAGEENLVAKGGTLGESPGAEKEEIQVLGEDLRPLHLDPSRYESRSPASRRSRMLLILLPPLLTALLGAALARRRRIRSDPAGIRQAAALREARSALVRAETAEARLQILRSYLGARLRLPGESLTSADSEERLARAGLPPELRKAITELLSSLQRAVYGGPNAASGSELQRCDAAIEEIFTGVERHAKR